jgi:UDP-N-acetylglucosamine acyltransferase
MVGFQAHVAQDVAPFMTADGNPLALRAINLTGLKRRDFGPARINAIKQMHRAIFRKGQTLDEAKVEIEALRASAPEAGGDIDTMLAFLAASTRGIVR